MAKKGGKKGRRGKGNTEPIQRELVTKEDDQEYAQVIKPLGDKRFELMCFDGIKRIGHVRGKFHKRVWIEANDVVLVGLRGTCDTSDTKSDIIWKYTMDEVRALKACAELPKNLDPMNAQKDEGEAAIADGIDDMEDANFNFDDI